MRCRRSSKRGKPEGASDARRGLKTFHAEAGRRGGGFSRLSEHAASNDPPELRTAQSGRYFSCSAHPLSFIQTPRRAIQLDANNRRPDLVAVPLRRAEQCHSPPLNVLPTDPSHPASRRAPSLRNINHIRRQIKAIGGAVNVTVDRVTILGSGDIDAVSSQLAS